MRDRVIFSMPLTNLQPAAMSIPSLLQPAKARQSGVVVVEDSDSEHPALAMEPDGENMLSIVPKAQAQLVQPAPGEDFGPSANIQQFIYGLSFA